MDNFIQILVQKKDTLGLYYDFFMLLISHPSLEDLKDTLNEFLRRRDKLEAKCAQFHCEEYYNCDSCKIEINLREIENIISRLEVKIVELD